MLATRLALRSLGTATALLALALLLAGLVTRLLPLRGGLLYTLSVDPSRHMLRDLDRAQTSLFRVGDAQMALASDGRRAFYLMDRPVPELVITLLDGTTRTWPALAVYSLDWSSDGQRLLVAWQPTPDQGRPAGLYWFSAQDGAPHLLSASERKHYGLSIRPQGEQALSFSVQDGTGYDLFLIDLDDGQARPLLASPAAETNPTWSADGQWIAYQQQQDGGSDIFRARADGTQPRNLTQHPALDTSPAWSPDGQWIAFTSNRGGSFQVYLMDAQGGQLERVTDESLNALYPIWLP